MTITVRISHESGEHDLEVLTAHPETGAVNGPAVRLSKGMSAFINVFDTQGIAIREIPSPQLHAQGGIGQVGVSVTPHVPATTTGEPD